MDYRVRLVLKNFSQKTLFIQHFSIDTFIPSHETRFLKRRNSIFFAKLNAAANHLPQQQIACKIPFAMSARAGQKTNNPKFDPEKLEPEKHEIQEPEYCIELLDP